MARKTDVFVWGGGRGEGGGEAILEKRERRSFLFSLSGQKKSEYSYKVDK